MANVTVDVRFPAPVETGKLTSNKLSCTVYKLLFLTSYESSVTALVFYVDVYSPTVVWATGRHVTPI